ncbi:S8 family serine peptidase [Bacillus kwashiorkori]|uniref:S8 family serine peptidase n=1 Tax=Bacillus kwashiorkori TaxID=1522318 RepID=UPI000AFC2D0B|nr:S8 family serine peptidase [Bacillus kwashiorkori]
MHKKALFIYILICLLIVGTSLKDNKTYSKVQAQVPNKIGDRSTGENEIHWEVQGNVHEQEQKQHLDKIQRKQQSNIQMLHKINKFLSETNPQRNDSILNRKVFTKINKRHDKDEIETAIIKTNIPLSKQEIQQLLKPYDNVKLRYIYKHVFPGFSIVGPKAVIHQLKASKKITNIYPSTFYQLNTQPTANQFSITSGIDYIGTKEVHRRLDKDGNRLTGKGIKIGIIDTGIDYTHPDLKHAYVSGYDFVDNDSDPMETKNLGEFNTVHGTHVAGVIAANGKMTGIAPDAKIYAYRALGPGGFGSTEQVLAAIEQAIKDKVDILNLSLGITINGPDLPTSLALDKAVDKGIVAVTSSGNSGPNIWTVGTPGTSIKAISVGASTPPLKVPYIDYLGFKTKMTPFPNSKPWDYQKSYEIADGKMGETAELTEIKGKIALIKRGKLTFTEKAKYAYEQGAIAVIIYNNTDGDFLGELEEPIPIPVASISNRAGKRLLQLMTEHPSLVKFTFQKEEDFLADFSSRGPVTYNWDIKPDIVAPGVAIESTVPNGYLPLQGTSMAAPHVAGAAALIKQAHPDWHPEKIKALLMNTSKTIKDEENVEYHTFEQGAGRLQLPEAIKSTSIITPATIRLGKAMGQPFEEKKTTLTIENISNQPIRYTFSIPKRQDELIWDLPTPFYLQPAEKKQITVELELKKKHQKNQLYDGFLELIAGSEKISIPYLYVVDEPNYPRIMSFAFVEGDKVDSYRYEVYLPGGADELGIFLYNPDTELFHSILDKRSSVPRGLIEQEINLAQLEKGVYKAIAYAKKGKKEDYLEQIIEIQ